MGTLQLRRLSDLPPRSPSNRPRNVSQCKHLVYIPGGRKAEARPRRIHYLLGQGAEMQKPVLSLLQSSGEFTVAKLQGQSSFFDLAQVTGTQPEQVLIKVGGRRYFMAVTQGLAMRDRWNALVHQGSTPHRGRCMYT